MNQLVQIFLLFFVLLNIFTHGTEEGEEFFSQGEYKIKKTKSAATATIKLVTTKDDIIQMYTTGDIVYVVEVHELKKEKRIRGKLDNGLWISLQNTQNEACWVKKLKRIIIEEPSQNVIKNALTNIYTKAKENIKLPDEDCMVCYVHFPVSLKFGCGHELCVICFSSILKKCNNYNCPKCRTPIDLPRLVPELLLMINVYPRLITQDIFFTDLQYAFPLICFVANLSTVKKCVNMGICVNTQGYQGNRPLRFASKNNINVVKYLVEHGAIVNPPNNGTPLFESCESGNLSVVKYLIKRGAEVNPVDQETTGNFVTPLCVSSQNDHLQVLKHLVQSGANVNQHLDNGVAPLFMGCQNGHLEIVQYLIQNEANVNQRVNDGMTPLLVSSILGYLSIIKCLVQNGGANVNQSRNDGTTALIMSSQNGYLQIVQYLIKWGANVNQANYDGATPLFVCSEEGHLLIVQYLIKNGADVNQINHGGVTPLVLALVHKRTKVAKFLLKNNAGNIEATKLFLNKHGFFEHIDTLDKLYKEIFE